MIVRDEKILRTPCQPVLDSEVSELVALLERELDNSARLGLPGIGLALPQVNIHKHLAIVRMGDVKIDLVNAKIEAGYDQVVFEDEGCLSFPGKLENTLRFKEIVVSNNGIFSNKFVATGLIAVAIQHELDHLNSTLFIDRLAPKQTQVINQNKVKPNDPCTCGKKNQITGKTLKYKKCCGR